MSAIAGRLSRVFVSFDNGATYNNLDGIVDATLNGNIDELETTSHDDDGIRKYIPNHSDFTADLTMRWDEASTTQIELLDTILPTPVLFKLRFMLENIAGRIQFEADCFATSYSPSSPLDDTAGLDVTLRLSAVTKGVVP